MAEENINTEEKEVPIVSAYVIYRYENGNTKVENAEIESLSLKKLSDSEIFNDIERVANQISERKQYQRTYDASLSALLEYQKALENSRRAAEVESASAEIPNN